MNILVIGNGFDKAHSLKTGYKDFIHFIEVSQFDCLGEDKEEFIELITNNVWIHYFSNDEFNDRWTDFEAEISKYVRLLDKLRDKDDFTGEWENKINYQNLEQINRLFEDFDMFYLDAQEFSTLKNTMYQDLNRLTRALEIYFCYIDTIDVEPNLPFIKMLNINKVISFNYTHTFERIYGNKNMQYDYIHGEAIKSRNIHNCQLVLGIGEYLNEEESKTQNEFIEFKKFYQRLTKNTSSDYKKWINEIKNHNARTQCHDRPLYSCHCNHIYIYGHSLDISDKDILQELFELENTVITIYYKSDIDRKDYNININKIIGSNELTERVRGVQKSIDFQDINELL